MDLDWTTALVDQLAFHWDHALRPRLSAMTDEQYRWEPVPSHAAGHDPAGRPPLLFQAVPEGRSSSSEVMVSTEEER